MARNAYSVRRRAWTFRRPKLKIIARGSEIVTLRSHTQASGPMEISHKRLLNSNGAAFVSSVTSATGASQYARPDSLCSLPPEAVVSRCSPRKLGVRRRDPVRGLLLDGVLGQLQNKRRKPLVRSLPTHPKHLSYIRPGTTPLNGAAHKND